MEDLIKALQIFLKYNNLEHPTYCNEETLYIDGITEEEVSEEDKLELDRLGFFFGVDGWQSYKYGG